MVGSRVTYVRIEMIEMLYVVVCPVVFAFICDPGHHAGLLRLMKNDPF